jgi:hypothetical protein
MTAKEPSLHPVLSGAETWEGWLLLSGGIPALTPQAGPLLNRLVELGAAAGNALCLAPETDMSGDLPGFLEGLEALLDISIRRVNLSASASETSPDFAILAGGSPGKWATIYQDTWLGDSLAASLQCGGCLLACGPAAAALGEWLLPVQDQDPSGPVVPGAVWLPGAAILIGSRQPGDHRRARQLLALKPQAYVLGLEAASVLGLGPDGQIELLAPPAPGILLGSRWRQS